jgi:predicted glycoside hydrolase/deacetylase ChbG (UPF0249 family)
VSEPFELVVCADDFGLSSGVNRAVLDLLQDGAINAASCLTTAPYWPVDARRLGGDANALLGLHLELPSPFVEAMDALGHFRRQWSAFQQGVSRSPDFVDGHRHIHLFPGPRRALFLLLEEKGERPWLRQCQTSSSRLVAKRCVLDPLSQSFREEARRRGYAVNPGFGGLRRFDVREDVPQIWRRDLEAMIHGGVLMVHPGWTSSKDALSLCRQQEAELLSDGALGYLLSGAGGALARGRPIWAAA